MRSELTSTDSLPFSRAELDSADGLAAVASTSPEPVAGSETEAPGVVFRAVFFGAADAFSALSTADAEDEPAEDPALALVCFDLAAGVVLEEPLPVAFDALAFDALAFDALDFAVEAFDPVVLEDVVFVPVDLEAVDFEPAGLDAEVLDDVVEAALVVPDFVDPAFVDPVFEDAVFEATASVSLSASGVVDVDRAVPDAFGLRRRDDCIDAAGSVRAVRDVFVSLSRLPSSEFPPEKNTSTGRSLEFASGINAPRPRPRPLFLRSTTTYSSIRNFFGGFPIRQGTAGMWVI